MCLRVILLADSKIPVFNLLKQFMERSLIRRISILSLVLIGDQISSVCQWNLIMKTTYQAYQMKYDISFFKNVCNLLLF